MYLLLLGNTKREFSEDHFLLGAALSTSAKRVTKLGWDQASGDRHMISTPARELCRTPILQTLDAAAAHLVLLGSTCSFLSFNTSCFLGTEHVMDMLLRPQRNRRFDVNHGPEKSGGMFVVVNACVKTGDLFFEPNYPCGRQRILLTWGCRGCWRTPLIGNFDS